MQTRTALEHMNGTAQGAGPFFSEDGPLAAIAHQLLSAFEQREAARMDAAEQGAYLRAQGPFLEVLQRRLKEAAASELDNSRLPMVSRFEAVLCLDAAKRAHPSDRAVKQAAAHFRRLWDADPEGSLTVGDVSRIRAHYLRAYPRSVLPQVIAEDLTKVGFNTLPVAKLARIAADVQGSTPEECQFAYEALVRTHGLDGRSDDQLRARAFIRSLVRLPENSDAPFADAGLSENRTARRRQVADARANETGGVVDRVLASMPEYGLTLRAAEVQEELPFAGGRRAQSDFPPGEMPMGDGGGGGGLPPAPDAPMAGDGHEEEVPHEEGEGTTIETTSPNTGEPIVLELELPSGDEGGDEGGEAGPPDESALDVSPEDVDGLAHFGQLADFAEPAIEGPAMAGEPTGGPMGGGGGGGGGMGGGMDVGMDEGAGGPVSTTIEDPSAPGEFIDVTLTAQEGDALGDDLSLGEGAPMPPDVEGDGGGPMSGSGAGGAGGPAGRGASRGASMGTRFAVYEIRGGVRKDEPLERFVAQSMPAALRHVAARVGSPSGVGSANFAVRSSVEEFGQHALVTLDEALGNHLYIVAEEKGKEHVSHDPGPVDLDPAISPVNKPDEVPVPEDGGAALKRKSQAPAQRLDTAGVARVAASVGFTAEDVLERLLNAETVSHGRIAIVIDDDARVQLTRAGRRARTAAFEQLDSCVADFLAHVAAEAQSAQPSGGAHAAAEAPTQSRRGSFAVRPYFTLGCQACGGLREYLMPDRPENVRCASCGYDTPAMHVAGQIVAREAAGLPADAGYVIVTDIPGEADLHMDRARQLMAAIEQIAPVQGQLRNNQLEIQVHTGDQGALNRVCRVLEDVYGVTLAVTGHERAAGTSHRGQAVAQDMQSTLPTPVGPPNPMTQGQPSAIAPTYQGPALTQVTMPGGPPAPPSAPPGSATLGPAQTGTAAQQDMIDEHATMPMTAAAQLWQVTYGEANQPGQYHTQLVEAASEAGARRLFSAFHRSANLVSVRRAKASTAAVGQHRQAKPPAAPPVPPPEAAPDMEPPPDDLGGDPAMDDGLAGAGAPGAAMAPAMPGSELVTPQIQEAIAAAMLTFRNTGIDQASGIDQFVAQFKDFLDKFGEKTSPQRQALGAAIVNAAQEAWAKPALLDLNALQAGGELQGTPAPMGGAIGPPAMGGGAPPGAGAPPKMATAPRRAPNSPRGGHVHVAEPRGMPSPGKIPAQHGPYVKLPAGGGKVLGPDSASDAKVTRAVEPKGKIKPHNSIPKGKLSPTEMGPDSGNRDPGRYKAPKPPAGGQYSPSAPAGVSFADKDPHMGGDLAGETKSTKKWDSVSKAAPTSMRSRPGAAR